MKHLAQPRGIHRANRSSQELAVPFGVSLLIRFFAALTMKMGGLHMVCRRVFRARVVFRGPACGLLLAVTMFMLAASPVQAALEVTGASNYAEDYAYYLQPYNYNNAPSNNTVNGSASVNDSYSGLPDSPSMHNRGSGFNSTDYSSSILVESSAKGYANAASKLPGVRRQRNLWARPRVLYLDARQHRDLVPGRQCLY